MTATTTAEIIRSTRPGLLGADRASQPLFTVHCTTQPDGSAPADSVGPFYSLAGATYYRDLYLAVAADRAMRLARNAPKVQ